MNALRGLGIFLSFIGLAAALTFLTVFPLWYGAIHWTRGFTYLWLIAFVTGTAALIVRRIIRGSRQPETKPRYFRKLMKFLGILVLTSLLYGIVWLFARRMYAAAVPAVLVYLAVLGVGKFGKWRTSKSIPR